MQQMALYKPHKNIRLKDYDYRNGWFFVTNKSDFGRPYFVNEIYEIVKKELEKISHLATGVCLDFTIIVPTHIHCILILENTSLSLSEIWRRYKARCTIQAKRQGFLSANLWQRNYFEHVIRSDKALEKIREYIRNNPLKEQLPLDEIYGTLTAKAP